jgi:oligopeptide transport system substrate-binding protein
MKFRADALQPVGRAFCFFKHVARGLSFLAACLLLGACANSEPPADITILNGAEPESLDPAIVTGQPDGRVVMALFEGLTRLNPKTATPEPAIAERWEISEDGRTYIFHLRTNAVWSTGEPITADDIVYSWRRVADPLTAADYSGQLYFVKNAEEINTGKIKDLTQLGAKALDPHTLKVELVAPTPFFLDLCAFRTLCAVPRQAIEKHGDRWLLEPPVPTSGAYVLDHWRIHDKIRVRKNPRHWDAANVQNNIVDFMPLDSAITAMNIYLTDAADIVWDKNLIPTELMDALTRRADCHRFDYLGTYFLRCNVTRKPFDDVRVRKALALVIDKDRIVRNISRSGEKPASALTPPGTANYQAPAGLGYDPEQARRLLADAGFPNGKGFPVFHYLFNTADLNKQIGVELKGMFKSELGINMELRQVEWKVYLAAQSAIDFDVSRSAWIGDYNDPNTFLDMFMSNNGNNRTGWKNARYDELMREGNQQIDPKKRMKLLHEAEALLVRDELPIIPLYFYVGVAFLDTNRIEGVHFNILDEHPIHAIKKKSVAGRL